jgi:hypothetical protein
VPRAPYVASLPAGPLASSAPPIRIRTRGYCHDLQSLFDGLNAHYFRGQVQARITWGRRRASGPPRRHRSVKMGSYAVEDRLIRIHPLLDRPFVPRYYVEWIIYHEMLHERHPIPVRAGRRCFHPPAFLAEEQLFEDCDRARRWEQHHTHHLLVF